MEVTDLKPAQDWLCGKRASLNSQSALDLWNWGGDVAHSAGLPWNNSSALRKVCYEKLFAAAVPWVFKQESYTPSGARGNSEPSERSWAKPSTYYAPQLGTDVTTFAGTVA